MSVYLPVGCRHSCNHLPATLCATRAARDKQTLGTIGLRAEDMSIVDADLQACNKCASRDGVLLCQIDNICQNSLFLFPHRNCQRRHQTIAQLSPLLLSEHIAVLMTRFLTLAFLQALCTVAMLSSPTPTPPPACCFFVNLHSDYNCNNYNHYNYNMSNQQR